MDRLFIETKILGSDEGVIRGVAWKFGEPDRIGDWIEPGAFKGAKLPIPMLFGHDMNDPVGTWDGAEEKADGLYVTGKLLINEVARAREILALIKAGAVRGLSLGFVIRQSMARKGGGRLIKSLEWLELSFVTVPMHAGAKVTSAKSAVEALQLAAAINRAASAIRN